MNATLVAGDGSEARLTALSGVLVQCFSIIASGYASMRLGLVTPESMGGIRALILYLLTPAIIVQALLTLRFHHVNWAFLSIIFAAKAVLFVAVAGSTILISGDYGKAGLYAMFTTQSNDLAFGVPLLLGVYGSVEGVKMTQYLYLAIPISLVVLSPLGFALLEFGARLKRAEASEGSLALAVFRSVAENPICIAAALGMVGNRIGAVTGVPALLTTVLDGFASAFVTVALFGLGTTFHRGGAEAAAEFLPVTPLVLVLAKGLLLPLLIRAFCAFLLPPAESAEMGFLGFLYGSLPTAPVLYVYASLYHVGVQQVSQGVALGTLLSGPWLFLTTHISGIKKLHPDAIRNLLHVARLNAGLISALLATLTLVVFFFKRRQHSLPHQMTMGFLVSAVVLGGGEKWWTVGVWGWFGQWIWGAAIPAALLLARSRSLCALLRFRALFICTGFGLQTSATILHFFLNEKQQTWFRLMVLLGSSLVTVTCLISQQRMARSHLPTTITMEPVTDIEDLQRPSDEESEEEGDLLGRKWTGEAKEDGDDLDGFLCSKEERKCSQRQRTACRRSVALYIRKAGCPQQTQEPDDVGAHVMLSCSVSVAMILHVFVLGGRLVGTGSSLGTMAGLYSQLQMLDVLSTFGLGSSAFLVLGVEPELVVSGLRRRWRRWRLGSERLALPTAEELDPVSRAICDAFTAHHLADCRAAVAENIREGLEVHPRAVRGSRLVDWLQRRGLASDATSATKYGMRLVLGRVLRHVREEEHFQDSYSALFLFNLPSLSLPDLESAADSAL